MSWMKEANEIVDVIEVQCLVRLKSGYDATITFCHPTNMAITTEGCVYGLNNTVSFEATDVTISTHEPIIPQVSYEIDLPELEDAPEEDNSWEISWD